MTKFWYLITKKKYNKKHKLSNLAHKWDEKKREK